MMLRIARRFSTSMLVGGILIWAGYAGGQQNLSPQSKRNPAGKPQTTQAALQQQQFDQLRQQLVQLQQQVKDLEGAVENVRSQQSVITVTVNHSGQLLSEVHEDQAHDREDLKYLVKLAEQDGKQHDALANGIDIIMSRLR